MPGREKKRTNVKIKNIAGKTVWEDESTGVASAVRAALAAGCDLSECDLSCANLSGADLPGAVPAVPGLDALIAAAVGDGAGLDMTHWHTCATVHCRGGWAIHFAGEAGRDLELRLGTNVAAGLIYAASRPGRVPDFYASAAAALADIRACANPTHA